MRNSSGTSSARCSGKSGTSRGSSAASVRRLLARFSWTGALLLLGLSAGCGGPKAAPQLPAGVDTHPPATSASNLLARRALEASEKPAPAHQVGIILHSTVGPFVSHSGDGALAVWMTPPERGSGQLLLAVPLASDGKPLSAPRVLSTAPAEVTNLVVRPAGGARAGWLVAWTAILDRGESLTVVGVSRDGGARGAPVDVARTSDHIRWCDVGPTAAGGIVVWAEEGGSGEASLLSAALGFDGKVSGMPARVARGVDRWQALPLEDGLGLALVTHALQGPAPGDRPSRDVHAGRVGWLRLDAQGAPRGPVVAIAQQGTVSSDVEMAAIPGGALLGWTDRTGEDAQVMLATVDGQGRVQGPAPALNAVGGAALAGLASGPAGTALAWEEPSAHGHARRALHLASVSLGGSGGEGSRLAAEPVSAVEVAQGAPPELIATSDGFALLAPAAACRGVLTSGSCQGPVMPTFVRFDARLQAVQAEPIVLGSPGETGAGAVTALGWDLGCVDGSSPPACLALAATGETPTPIFSVEFAARTSPFSLPTQRPPPADAPRVLSLSTIASGAPYDDIAAASLGDMTVVAALAGPAADRRDPRREAAAVLSLMVIDGQGHPQGALQTLSSRALGTGGIAVAAGAVPQDGAAVAWVTGRDEDSRQVHVARLDAHGRRTREIELTTRARGDVTSVAMAWAGDGWLVAWVDGRDGNGEVYASKVDRDLVRVAHEERITTAAGDAGDLALAVRGPTAWLAWSDPRESPREGLGDIYATTLNLKDAKRATPEVRVLASAPHSRSPQLAPTPDGNAVVAWIEDAATGLEGPGAAMIALLDREGRVAQSPEVLALSGDGRPTSIVLEPSRDGARAVVVRSSPASVSLDAVAIAADGGPAGKPWPLLDVEAPASFDVAVALAGDALVFDDVGGAPGDHHVRRAAVAWRR